MSATLPAPAAAAACPNCGALAPRAYCADCGQAQHAAHRPLRAIVGEALETFAGWDGKIPRTVWTLVRHPGRLTADYVAGRRARYLPPLRLYLIAGALLFLAFQAAESRLTGFELSVKGDVDIGVPADTARPGVPRPAPAPDTAAAGPPAGAWQKLKQTRFRERMDALNRMSEAEREREVKRAFFARAGTTFFLLLPVFALLVAGFYFRRPHAYAEHLVFVLHAHAFAALALAAAALVGGGWGLVSLLALPPYAFVALRAVYGGSRLRTLAKLVGLGGAYLAVLAVGMVATAMVAFFVG